MLPEVTEAPLLKYVFFDPGKTTGWAIYDESGTLRFFGQLEGTRELDKFLAELPESVEYYIYEDYIVRPGVNHSGSRVVAVNAIGHIESAATFRHKRYESVQPSQKTIGYRRLKMTNRGDHSKSHKFDAIAHGEVWVWKNRVRKEWAKREESSKGRSEGIPDPGISQS